MPAKPEPNSPHTPGNAMPGMDAHANGPAQPITARRQATILPWRPRAAPGPDIIGTRPFQAPGNRIGTARGLLLGLLLGTVLWTVIGFAVWRLLLR